jgi:hypothetical protein
VTAVAVRRRATVLVAAAALFVVLTIAAMFAYRGGSSFDTGARHYLFFGNFFSDLGVTVTYSGRANTVSRALFVGALVPVGIAFAWSAPAWRAWALRDDAPIAAAIVSAVAVLVGFGFVAIAVTPRNRDYDAHVVLVQSAFALLLVFVASLLLVQVRNGTAQPWIGVNLACLLVLVAYVVVAVAGPSVATVSGLRLQVVAQKVVVYASILNLSLQAWGVARLPAVDPA